MIEPFGRTRHGEEAHLVRLEGDGGLRAAVGDVGATLIALSLPDREGRRVDVVLGFDSVAGYEGAQDLYVGASIGRVAGRIAGAAFDLDGRTYRLAANEPPHHRHGGAVRSFDRVRWSLESAAVDAVTLRYVAADGEEGYPGRVEATATYRLEGGALLVEYRATTDATTPVGMTSHAYWNLRGDGGTVLDHEVRIAAAAHLAVDDALIPTGEVAAVAGTPLDLRAARPVRDGVRDLAGSAALGYDHCYVLDGTAGALRLAAEVRDPGSGRVLEVRTDQPCLQLYSGNHLPAGLRGRGGATYGRHGGLCLEPQGHPDALHHPGFPSPLLHPGSTYRHRSVYRVRSG